MAFLKEDLEGLYNWSSETSTTTFEGQPSRRLFNRWNGNQVLFIINLVLDNSGNFSIEQGKKIESLIINKLPFEPSSELTVFNWLQKEILVHA
jgi:hypothetical protein